MKILIKKIKINKNLKKSNIKKKLNINPQKKKKKEHKIQF